MSEKTAGKTFAVYDNPASKKLILELETTGAKVFKFSPIVSETIVPDENAAEIAKKIESFDWLIFPDVLAVDFFLQILAANETDLFELDALRFCAFGEQVADQLRFVQLHTDVIPSRVEAETILSSLKDYIGADNLADLKFLIPKEDSHQIELVEKLKLEKAKVEELPVYQIKISDTSEVARMKTLLAGGAIDEFVFTAPTDFIHLRYVFGSKPLTELLSEIKVSAIDGNLFQMLKEHDFKHAVLFRTDKIAKVDK